ncbi:mastermind-like protein 2 isoform 2-T2 [Pelodytes ibericus]
MGETAPLQTTPGSLGIGVAGVGLLGGGAVTPRVHSAIVERLRARIAACREHHRSCQGRYERSRAESSDRERENTLQLLTLVQHGQGTRKSNKHTKSAPPPDYHHHQQQHQHLFGNGGNGSDMNGNQTQQTSNGLDQRNSALIALQGSLKRRLVVNVSPANNKRANGTTDNSFLDFKKIRANEHHPAAQNVYHGVDGLNQSTNGAMSMEHRKTHTVGNANCEGNDMFNLTLKDIKKEPGESISCGKHLDVHMSQENLYRYGDDLGEQLMDPELQELFNELTYISVPPMSDIELQNMINITIKQDEPFNIDLGQCTRNTPPSLPLDKVIKSEYPQGLDPVRVGSPQLRPSSTGPAFSMASTSLTSSASSTAPHGQAQVQVSSSGTRLPSWQELSHAQQLKQIAANRQHTLIQQHQPNQSSGWSNVPPTGASSRAFGQEKVPSPFRQQQLSPHRTSMSGVPINGSQTKAISNYLYKPGSIPQTNHLDLMSQQKAQDSNKNSVNSNHSTGEQQHHSNTKPLFHYSPDHQVSSALNAQSKPILQFTQQQQQNLLANQQHEQLQQAKPLPNQTVPRTQAFQHKMLIPKMQPNQPISGLHYPSVHQQQQHSTAPQGATSRNNPSPNNGSGYNSQQPLMNQQIMEKTNILQRQMIEQKQLIIQQQMLSGTDKGSSQDQLNRHLTRPPPDYKDQRRNNINLQQGNPYNGSSPTGGVNSNPAVASSIPAHISPQNSGHSSTNHSSRMSSLQGQQNTYGSVPQQSMYTVNPGGNQIQPQTSPNSLGTNQNGHCLPRQTTAQGNTLPPFGTGTQFRSGTIVSGQRTPNSMGNSSAATNWLPPDVKKQDGPCFPNNNPFPNQSFQNFSGNQHFTQRTLALPNQVAPGTQMRPLNQMSQANSGQSMESLRSLNLGQTQPRAPNLPSLSQASASATTTSNTFTSSNQHSRSFQGTDSSNDLGSFDYLSQNNGLGSSLNSDSDFIDALLKTGHINDDWMKDINLDEIFKNHS